MNTIVVIASFLMTVIAWLVPFFLIGFGIWLIINHKKMNLRKLDERGVFWTAIFGILGGLLIIALDLSLI